MPDQPKDTIYIQVRLKGEMLPGRTIPLNMLPYIVAIIQADIYETTVERLLADEINAELLANVPKKETGA